MFKNIGAGELLIIFFFLTPIILWVAALIDLLTSKFQGSNKIVWLIVIIFLPVLGVILYFIIGRGQKISKNNSQQ
jgi:hypothetical protein